MPRIKEGKVVRERLEEIFDTKFFYQPMQRVKGKNNKTYIPLRNNKEFNCNSLELYRAIEDGLDIGVRTMFSTMFFCLDIDNKENKPSIYYEDPTPILQLLDDIGLEARIISTNPQGGRKIWVPLPICIEPNTYNELLEEYLTLSGLTLGRGTLELLGRRRTEGEVDYYSFSKGGKSPYVRVTGTIGDVTRLPLISNEYLQLHNLDNSPQEFTLEEFFGDLWNLCIEINSEFDYFTLENKVAEIKQQREAPSLSLDERSTGELPQRCYIVDSVNNPVTTSPVASKCTKTNKQRGGQKSNQNARGTKEERNVQGLLGKYSDKSSMQQDCLDLINRGWTSSSQSMQMMAAISVLCSIVYRTYSELQLAREITSLATSIKGYKEFASKETKEDIEKDIRRSWGRRWSKSVLKYREQLFAKGVLSRKHDYAIRLSDTGYWIEAFSEDGKSRYRGSKRVNKGTGKGGRRNIIKGRQQQIDKQVEELYLQEVDNEPVENHIPIDEIQKFDVEATLAELEQRNVIKQATKVEYLDRIAIDKEFSIQAVQDALNPDLASIPRGLGIT